MARTQKNKVRRMVDSMDSTGNSSSGNFSCCTCQCAHRPTDALNVLHWTSDH